MIGAEVLRDKITVSNLDFVFVIVFVRDGLDLIAPCLALLANLSFRL